VVQLSPLLVALLLPAHVLAAGGERDSDGDGLSDLDEARVYRTDSQLADTDTDGLPDGLEIERYWTDPLAADSDGDGYLDGVEVRLNTDPAEAGSHPAPRFSTWMATASATGASGSWVPIRSAWTVISTASGIATKSNGISPTRHWWTATATVPGMVKRCGRAAIPRTPATGPSTRPQFFQNRQPMW